MIVTEAPFSIPYVKAELCAGGIFPRRTPVIPGPIRCADVDVHQQVVDEIIEIEPFLNLLQHRRVGGILRAGEIPELVPFGRISLGDFSGLRDYIPVLASA